MHNKYITLISIIFLFIISLNLITSAPPQAVQSLQTGVQISYINPYYITTYQNLSIRFWVYNISNGAIRSNATLNCTYNLLDHTGKNIIRVSSPQTSGIKFGGLGIQDCVNCFNLEILGGNFSRNGLYEFQIRCQDSGGLGGFYNGYYEVNPTGNELLVSRTIIDIGLLITLILFLIVSIYLFINFNNLILRVSMIGISYLFLIAISFICWNMSNDFLISAPFLTAMFKIVFYVLIIGFFPLIIGSFAWYVLMLWKIKEIERLMGKGFTMEEAERRQGSKYK